MTSTKQPTELKLALEKVKDLQESAYYNEIFKNFQLLKARGKQIGKDTDLLQFQDKSDETFSIKVKVGVYLTGRVFICIDESSQIRISLSIEHVREKYELWSEKSNEGHLYIQGTQGENPFGINTRHLVNSKLVDQLVIKMIERIEYHVLNPIQK